MRMRIDSITFEHAVFLRQSPNAPHRAGMTAEQVQEWIDTWQAQGGSAESFYVACRAVGPWEFMLGDEQLAPAADQASAALVPRGV